MINYSRVNDKVYKIMAGFGLPIIAYNDNGMETADSSEASRIYSENPNIMVTVDKDSNTLRVNMGSDVEHSEYAKLFKQLRNIANQYMIDYSLKDYDKTITPRDFSKEIKTVSESFGKLYGSKKTSYQDDDDVKIVIKHKKEVSEDKRGSRTRNISTLFLEKHVGNRVFEFKLPTKNLATARALARHMQKGGYLDDDFSSHIMSLSEKLQTLKEFILYSRKNKLINETSNAYIELVNEEIASLSNTMKRLSGNKSYDLYRSSFNEQATSSMESNVDSLRDMFTVKMFDNKFENVLNVINELHQTKLENKIDESLSNVIYIKECDFTMLPILEFTNEKSLFAYKLKTISENIIGHAELAERVRLISERLVVNELQDRDILIIEQLLSNIKVK